MGPVLNCKRCLEQVGWILVIVAIFDFGAGVHQFHGGLIAFRNGEFMLDADVSKGVDVELWGSNPAETLAEGVVWIHDIPMAGCIRNRH